jgi:hypothetical protein
MKTYTKQLGHPCHGSVAFSAHRFPERGIGLGRQGLVSPTLRRFPGSFLVISANDNAVDGIN